MPGQHDRSSNEETKFDAWTVDVSPHHKTVQDQRQYDMKGRRTLYDYVHHLRQISGNLNNVPPNSDVLSPQK